MTTGVETWDGSDDVEEAAMAGTPPLVAEYPDVVLAFGCLLLFAAYAGSFGLGDCAGTYPDACFAAPPEEPAEVAGA